MRKLVQEHPALPVWWGKNQAGMQAREELDDQPIDLSHGAHKSSIVPRAEAQKLWLEARDCMIAYSDKLAQLGLHKQLCNRLTEPWMPITVLVSATSFANWFHLRDHKDAQPEIQVIATEMRYQYLESQPEVLKAGEWHLPYTYESDRDSIADLYDTYDPSRFSSREEEIQETLRAVSVGRCARVSYLTHDGKRDLIKDIELHDKLAATATSEDPGHFSPFEHVAQALEKPDVIGNFTGWRQYRKAFATEAGPTK